VGRAYGSNCYLLRLHAETRQASSLLSFIFGSLRGYCASFQNFHNGCHGRIDFGVGVVEVRGEADSRFGAPVYENVAGEEFTADWLGIGHVDGDRTPASRGIAGSVDAPSVLVGELDEAVWRLDFSRIFSTPTS
jgi:hypothetical protein